MAAHRRKPASPPARFLCVLPPPSISRAGTRQGPSATTPQTSRALSRRLDNTIRDSIETERLLVWRQPKVLRNRSQPLRLAHRPLRSKPQTGITMAKNRLPLESGRKLRSSSRKRRGPVAPTLDTHATTTSKSPSSPGTSSTARSVRGPE